MPEQLGGYVLDKRIGAGGMADVFLARGPRGVCVIKRPHSHLCASADFVRMFLDEASLLAQLHHPSIAQIFELGQENGVYFLAMEYVPGFDLMTISLEHERQGEYMAPELAAKVVADAAGALHYAHDAVGNNGEPLRIIHRDVSPHNVLVSTRGEVKLIDFGVARAAKMMHRTQAGLVKGKYPYMAPEQITGQLIDRRVDVYALGLVLYELLTNARAIAGDLEVQQIENARHGRIKPVEQLRGNVPATLRKILATALHPQAEGRYQTAAALQSELEAYIVADRHVVGREDLLRLFRVVAAEASHLPPEFDSAPAPAAEPVNSADTMRSGAYQPSGPQFPASSAETLRSDSKVKAVSRVPDDAARPTDQVAIPEQAQAESASTYIAPIALVDAVPAGVVLGGAAQPAPLKLTEEVPYGAHPMSLPTQATPYPGSVVPPPAPAVVRVPSQPAAPVVAATPSSNLGRVVAGLLIVAVAAGATYQFWPKPPPAPLELPPPPPLVVKEPPPPVVEPRVEPGVEEPSKPVDPVPLPTPTAEPVKAAVVHVATTPAMEVVVDGKSWGVTPIDVEVLGGKHTFVLQQLDLGLRRVSALSIGAGERRELGWAPKKGKIVVNVTPFGDIAIDGKTIRSGKSVADVEAWEGKHSVTVSNDELKKKLVRPVVVKGDETAEVTVNLLDDSK